LALPATALILAVMAAILTVVFLATYRVAEDYRHFRAAQYAAEARRLVDTAVTEIVSAGLLGQPRAVEARRQALVEELETLWSRQGAFGIIVGREGRLICLIDDPWCGQVLDQAPEEGPFHLQRRFQIICGEAFSVPVWGWRVVVALPRVSVLAANAPIGALVPGVLAGAVVLVAGILLLIRRTIQRPVGMVLAGLAEGRDIAATGVREIDAIGAAVNDTFDALRSQNQQLRALDRVKDGLLRDVSHELKTPVAKQAMQIELLRSHLDAECRGRAGPFLAVMESSVRRQQRVIRNLLDLARLEAGGRPPAIGPVALDDLSRRVIEEYRFLLDEKRVALSGNLGAVTALADGELLWHVVSNLLGNAIKFLRPDIPGEIAVETAREGDAAVLRVRDNGIGLDPDQLARVFERFYQATAAAEGSGVGLSICQRLVGDMGGTIALTSPGLGAGTTATVRLPLAP
jgi:signal transduction histidine kinase